MSHGMTVVARSCEAALERGIEFIIGKQDADGAWRDFKLAPGRSEAWTTAYVGSALANAACIARIEDCDGALRRAVSFVKHRRDARGGWGYNRRCPPDADSTARAILFLQTMGAVELRDYAALARFQLRDGAFPTYKKSDARGGWCRGHPDVTAVALQALGLILRPDHVIMRRGYARLTAYLARREPAASYWWPSPLYLAKELLALRAFKTAPQFAPALPQPSSGASCFERALALEIALAYERDHEAREVFDELTAAQSADGGWPSAPILRVTDPRSSRRGRVYADDRRLFTTATVLAAISRRCYRAAAAETWYSCRSCS